jgi:hypothetical protein
MRQKYLTWPERGSRPSKATPLTALLKPKQLRCASQYAAITDGTGGGIVLWHGRVGRSVYCSHCKGTERRSSLRGQRLSRISGPVQTILESKAKNEIVVSVMTVEQKAEVSDAVHTMTTERFREVRSEGYAATQLLSETSFSEDT